MTPFTVKELTRYKSTLYSLWREIRLAHSNILINRYQNFVWSAGTRACRDYSNRIAWKILAENRESMLHLTIDWEERKRYYLLYIELRSSLLPDIFLVIKLQTFLATAGFKEWSIKLSASVI